MIEDSVAQEVLAKVRTWPGTGTALRRQAMGLLAQLPSYGWAGVYRLEGDTLVLDEFVGDPTEHIRIPVGVGVCGTAVAEGRNQIVQDVSELSNYLSCSIKTRAEIVVLVRSSDGSILGQIDIDGPTPGCFDASDERMLEQLAGLLAAHWS